MDIQEDNDPWDNIVAGDGPTCLVRLDYLAEGEVVADAEDDGNIQNSLDRKGSSYNAAKGKAGTQAEDPHEESKEALGLLKIATTFITMFVPHIHFTKLTLNQMLLGVMLSSSGLLLVLILFFSVGSLSLPRFLGRCGCRLRCWLRRS